MEVSAFSVLNSTSLLFSTFGSDYKRSRRNLVFRKSSVGSRRRCFLVKSVAGGKQQKLEDPPPAIQEKGIVLDPFSPDSASVASSIKYHAEFSPLFSPEVFNLAKAYYATAESVRDMLIINWNATNECYEKLNVKQAYYLSMEFLQGRALLNAIGNLELTGAYAEALKKLGHNLEDVARQEPDAALGNGGLGRLASCFLDSMATLNYPGWGYGLRYRYGLFKQLITKDGQEEVAENWLEIGNPWEIVRNDVFYPVKFYGKVIEGPGGRKQWVGGEDIIAVAYDVPIPGYKTKTTLNLRLWSTKVPSEVFDLRAFNAGDHAKAYEALKKAEKICYVLYPGDESYEGKTLRLKQQYTLCSASLQDIITRFERKSGEPVKWEKFPEKVALQMNDTHPTLCIPELMRILIDVKGLNWEEAWKITQRTVAYTNHTVLPEALEKWDVNLMQQLLPRHFEIIRKIEEELIDTIIAEYGTEDLDLIQKKLKQMRILDNMELPSSVLKLLIKSQESVLAKSVKEDEDSESVKVIKSEESVLAKSVNEDEDSESVKEDEDSESVKEDEDSESVTVIKSQESVLAKSVNEDEDSESVKEDEDSESDKMAKPISKDEVKRPNDKDETKKPKDKDKKPEISKAEKKVKLAFEPNPKQPQLVRMANLCVVGGHTVNGVAEIHSGIVKKEVFNDFYQLWPEKFQNKTNGVTPRRWMGFCNPELSKIITKWTGSEDWLINTEKLVELRKFADNEELQSEWREAKRNNKKKVASFLKEKTGYVVSPDAMFDVQIKRIHEYKRQLLNIMGIVYRYKKMKEMSQEERKKKFVPRVCIFGGKAFATYVQAKRIVKFITDVGATINHDPEIGDLLKVVFVPDYNVSVAEVLIPGSELSQHISTAGMEASGTSNMKFSMNGCVLIGTLDGANVEIREEVGEDNFFLFGAHAEEIAGLRQERAKGKFVPDPRFEEVKAFVRTGVFGPYNYNELMGSLEGNKGYGRADYFLVGKDFPSYIECQEKVNKAYKDQKKWTKMSILNTAGSFKFSSDRTIHQYARDIWMIEPVVLP